MTAIVGVVLFCIAFLLGSIPWGLIISKGVYKTDIRQHGSGNIGTTNAFRAMGKVGGSAVFVLDFGKGLLSGFIALNVASAMQFDAGSAAYLTQVYLAVAFLGCVWGHIFSPWLGFKGGKGIAVAIGCLFITLGSVPSIIELALFGITVVASRYVSLGSVLAALLCPFMALWTCWGNWPSIALCTVAALTVVWAHRGNIQRLASGTERKVGKSK